MRPEPTPTKTPPTLTPTSTPKPTPVQGGTVITKPTSTPKPKVTATPKPTKKPKATPTPVVEDEMGETPIPTPTPTMPPINYNADSYTLTNKNSDVTITTTYLHDYDIDKDNSSANRCKLESEYKTYFLEVGSVSILNNYQKDCLYDTTEFKNNSFSVVINQDYSNIRTGKGVISTYDIIYTDVKGNQQIKPYMSVYTVGNSYVICYSDKITDSADDMVNFLKLSLE